jgi:serine/threonine protein kinase
LLRKTGTWEALVQEHLKQHGNNPQQSLASISSVDSVCDELAKVADVEVQASLAQLPLDRSGRSPASGTLQQYLRSEANAQDATVTVTRVGATTSTGSRFRILRLHAKGGLGQVFVAEDEELHREVALKEIQDQHAHDPESRARFLLEAEITGGLEHPGIVPVYGLGQYADGRPFYAMRFIRGDSLRDAIERYHQAKRSPKFASQRLESDSRTLEFRKLLGRFIDVCNAIAYAHSRGVLHRDLKPGNVMLGKYGETLVVDWGLAKPGKRGDLLATPGSEREPTLRPASESGSTPTRAGARLGTPAYMSPEQAAGRLDQLGPATDVYSLGATLYCLLTGQPPFGKDDLEIICHKVERVNSPRRVRSRATCLRRWRRFVFERWRSHPQTVTRRRVLWQTIWSIGWPMNQ